MLGCLMDGSVEDIAECSGGEIGDFEYDAGIDLGVVVVALEVVVMVVVVVVKMILILIVFALSSGLSQWTGGEGGFVGQALPNDSSNIGGGDLGKTSLVAAVTSAVVVANVVEMVTVRVLMRLTEVGTHGGCVDGDDRENGNGADDGFERVGEMRAGL
ncbi:Hypothetical predicted protein [Octopus vulgaris]|uniref:Uncharacterized protein n=1 Tax=Octopus vulgaris TaxID=6645 RepID=A0AA36F5D9_OCTVU|nr:Hypothetical predicted protein [Octopus vulgaris]